MVMPWEVVTEKVGHETFTPSFKFLYIDNRRIVYFIPILREPTLRNPWPHIENMENPISFRRAKFPIGESSPRPPPLDPFPENLKIVIQIEPQGPRAR